MFAIFSNRGHNPLCIYIYIYVHTLSYVRDIFIVLNYYYHNQQLSFLLKTFLVRPLRGQYKITNNATQTCMKERGDALIRKLIPDL